MRKKILTLVLISLSFVLNAQTEYPIKQPTQKVNNSPWYGLGESNIIFPDASYNAMQLAGFYGLLFKTGSGEMSLLNNGNVGIGTFAPSHKLEIKGNSADFYIRQSSGNYSAGIGSTNTGEGFLSLLNNAANYYSQTVSIRANAVSYFNGGNVGIGITDPQSTLEVNGALTINWGTFYFDRSSNKEHYKICSPAWNDGLQYHHYTSHKFFTQGTEKLIIKQNGNVGIGTTETGTHKLAVDGTIGAREIIVEAGTWSDFVFNENYELRNLEEVESYIEENNHLPDIPSEKEVIENGIQIGEMNAKLLQKIEELTLYMIEMNKRMKSIEAENIELKYEIKELKSGQ